MKNWYLLQTGQFGYPQPEGDMGYINKTYDSKKACLTCNIGLEQNNEFRFRSEPKAKHSQFLGLNWVFDQVFVRHAIKDVFEKEQVTGITFSQPVYHKTGLPINELYQLRVDNFVCEGLYTDNLKTEICEYPKDEKMIKFLLAVGCGRSKLVEGPFCGQTKYNFPQGDNHIKLKADSLNNKTDFVRLDYYFGSGGSANRPIIISDRVKQIIDREKWRGAFLQQIELV
jgi:hypothetical protein